MKSDTEENGPALDRVHRLEGPRPGHGDRERVAPRGVARQHVDERSRIAFDPRPLIVHPPHSQCQGPARSPVPVELPDQGQGEGLAVSARGHVYLSSEGQGAPLLEVALPDALAGQADTPAADQLGPRPSPPPASVMRHRPSPQQDTGLVIWAAGGVLALAVLGWVLVTFALPRSRRTR